MASLLEDSRTYYIAGGALATCVSLLAARQYMKSRAARKDAEKRKAYPANTVILHQIGRGAYAPSLSPFPLKLETYLRMAKIPYQNEHGFDLSSKGKTPWITYNGEDLDDSQFCIDFLTKKLNKDMNGHLNKEQRAVARSMQKMVDESLYWILALERWVYNVDNYKFLKRTIPGAPMFIFRQISSSCRAATHAQGYGRHTREEARSIGRGDCQTLSDYIGTKPFLMGDQPCEVDCALFGMLAQANWHAPDTSLEKWVKVDFPNLSDYCERMKDRFWPDWDECNTAGGTKKEMVLTGP